MYEKLFHECDRLQEVAHTYKKTCSTIYKDLLNDVVRTEYARGGETIHRGYYCPSPVYDIIVGGASRGRLLKDMKRIKKNPDYTFGFNANNELIVIQNSFYREYIVRDQHTELSIIFSKYCIEAITECRYVDNQIQSYIYCLLLEGKVDEYRKEEYFYGDEGLQFVDWYHFMPMRIHIPKEITELVFDKGEKMPPIYSHEKYEFTHKNGYLYQYREIPVNDSLNKSIPTFPDIRPLADLTFDVRLKRKV